MKVCPKCKINKSSKDFYKDKSRKDSLSSYCKECRRPYKQSIKYKEYSKLREKERTLKRTETGYWKTPEYKIIQNKRRKTKGYKLYHIEYEKNIRDKEKRNIYRQNRYSTDINWKIGQLFRNRIVQIIKHKKRSGSVIRDMGCSVDELKSYLESKFQPGMSWDNWTIDGWHVDHIIPLAKFDLTDRRQFLTAVNYKNLQPLWAKDNLSKNKY